EAIVNEVLQKLDKMHPVIYENLAWFYLKKGQIKEAINYLKEAKKNGHPGFKEIKNSKYFKKLKSNSDFIKLFN
ncbi:MAG: tetratricopeptide repeat protein, partial [Promethearchaeota archaeon]